MVYVPPYGLAAGYGSSFVFTTSVQYLLNSKEVWNVLFTPRYISVSSKHVLSLFDDGNRVTFPITPSVESGGSPTVNGGAVTKNPARIASNSRCQELTKTTSIKCILRYYSRVSPEI